jgi:uncharacterized protein GlcG (DUF336 family)
MKRALTLLLAAQAAASFAQTPPPRVPPAERPNNPLALPGDNPPPPLEAMMAPPRPQTAPPSRPPALPAPVDSPPAALALEAAQAALARCGADGLKVGVAVSDSAGNLLIGLTMDGTVPGRIYNAARKNLVAIAFKSPSSAVQTRLRAGDKAAIAIMKPGMSAFPGAVPIMAGEKLLGAIGISGQANGKDEICAAAGVAAIAGKLR